MSLTTSSAATSLSSAASSAVASSSASSLTSAATGTAAAAALTGNENQFLSMLMTQLKNQDPTSPMDTSQFTTELVQFSGVEQQIQTNTGLTSLIQLTQDNSMLQGSSMVGKQVEVANSDMALQNGTGEIDFNTPAAQNITISVRDSSGTLLQQTSGTSTIGKNYWSWDGKNSSGTTQADGDYKVSVTTTDTTGATTTVPFNVIGTVTGVATSGTALNLQMGGMTTAFSNVQSVLATTSSSTASTASTTTNTTGG